MPMDRCGTRREWCCALVPAYCRVLLLLPGFLLCLSFGVHQRVAGDEHSASLSRRGQQRKRCQSVTRGRVERERETLAVLMIRHRFRHGGVRQLMSTGQRGKEER